MLSTEAYQMIEYQKEWEKKTKHIKKYSLYLILLYQG